MLASKLSTKATVSTSVSSPVSISTLRFVARFIWSRQNTTLKRSDDNQQETEILAAALNLLTKKPQKSSPLSYSIDYKPSLFKAVTRGSSTETLPNESPFISEADAAQHISFINSLIRDVNLPSSTMLDINAPKLLNEMNASQLSSYIKSVQNENVLIEIVHLFLIHKRLNLRVLGDVIMHPKLVNLRKLPFNLDEPEKIQGIQGLSVVKLRILLLRKYQMLHQPNKILANLKQNIEEYLSLIKKHQLSAHYERTVWRFAFNYMKQYDQLHYIKVMNNIRTSALIWQASSQERSRQVASWLLMHHGDKLNQLEKIFWKLAQSTDDFQLKRLAIKYKVEELDQSLHKVEELDQSLHKVCYSFINELEKFLINTHHDQSLNSVLDELTNYRAKYIKYVYSKRLDNTGNDDISMQEELTLHRA
ncbi:hypothetical protein KGF56_000038 [Candida oxycetoniae]|uniref:Uncharacterized protein n=1 Tax=Candida oxycetoniae TaxID=497107 RepID=A0AAI9X061_9ASCO|nr:uncharacterized protein KGF56_000038 [Candida oxycetoniae]KAI3407136.2 hypothetical protein KGF56_000038 [Candida oxycetoniae]